MTCQSWRSKSSQIYLVESLSNPKYHILFQTSDSLSCCSRFEIEASLVFRAKWSSWCSPVKTSSQDHGRCFDAFRSAAAALIIWHLRPQSVMFAHHRWNYYCKNVPHRFLCRQLPPCLVNLVNWLFQSLLHSLLRRRWDDGKLSWTMFAPWGVVYV